jgi:hypothetical protein
MIAVVLLEALALAGLARLAVADHRVRMLQLFAVEVSRLTAELPPVGPLDWPMRVTPLALPGIGETEALAAVPGRPRVAEPAMVAELRVAGGRHHLGEALGTREQQVTWDTPTGQFWLIVDSLGDLEEPCSHCAAPEDGELAHVGCPGCACPCGLAVAA